MYDPDTFLNTLDTHLDRLADIAEEQVSTETIGALMPALHIVGMGFRILHEINNNLNRIAVAQEEMSKVAQADLDEFVQQKINEGVEIKLAEKPKRDYIGK